ncbi:hypothetical protein OV208_18530 [Corallococcus sp. bb12-1]|uniref:hypothetical protein n=1 Tax=Corallococcus sp. bb12-1 TaxID=2996784 RepID=UPI00226F9FBE|nr:hypothetical protein [Corallococcus sp. bb12-1]MCY1043320.1 hypothetical protein [Corallococcus sp. bb12-1]
MPALTEYPNVSDTALIILKQKGFQVWYDKMAEAFCAEKDGWDFMATSPCGLLGVVAIYEHKHPEKFAEYWWRERRSPSLYDNLPDGPRPYTPVWQK